MSASELPSFDYQPRTRVVFGAGVVTRLGELAKELGGTRSLIVTDPGILRAGHVEQAIASLTAAGLEATVFSDVQPNPTTDDVDRCLAVARTAGIDLLIGLGGGSAMDCAKGCNFLLTNGGRMEDYWGVGKATKPMLPMIAIPTTSGTGSEAQSFALIAKADSHMKMACGDSKAACRVALLDPDLTLSLPASVTAATGIDAISHAVESFVTTKRNPVSQLFSRKAWQLLVQSFPHVVGPAPVAKARAGMLLGSHLAGAAIENSMLGATHALANPLSAHFGVTHGVAIGIMLPHVVRFNAVEPATARGYEAIADSAETLATQLEALLKHAGLNRSLTELGANREMILVLAEEASKQWTASFNPRTIGEADFRALYAAAF